jgi:predicted dehydrogenase
MAINLSDARKITRLCLDNGIKAAVSHQQKYTKQMQRMYECVRSGVLGESEFIRVFMRGWAGHVATHFIDYALWMNGGTGAEWAVGHVSGRIKLDDNHPSPDFMMGEVRLKNGASLLIESGYLSPLTLPDEKFWTNARICFYGTHGYSWAETEGRWAVFSPETKGKLEISQFPTWKIQESEIQTPFYTDFALWLENDAKKHPCNIEISLHGFEIMEGIYKSALEHTRVDFPIQGELKDALGEMEKILPTQTYPPDFENQLFYKKGKKAIPRPGI